MQLELVMILGADDRLEGVGPESGGPAPLRGVRKREGLGGREDGQNLVCHEVVRTFLIALKLKTGHVM